MLDLHAVSVTPAAKDVLTDITTILLGTDGVSAAGVPIMPGATLKRWGVMTTIADTIEEAMLYSQDMDDPQNGERFALGAGSLIGIVDIETLLAYTKGRRVARIMQNTAAAASMGYFIDQYATPAPVTTKSLGNHSIISQLFAGALTAVTWRSQAFAPATNPPAGKYAILGAWVNALTNYALIRFAHASFKGFKPGFAVKDNINTAVANAVLGINNKVFANPGMQFVELGDVPTFDMTSIGSGLNIEMSAITADTPNVTLNLCRVG